MHFHAFPRPSVSFLPCARVLEEENVWNAACVPNEKQLGDFPRHDAWEYVWSEDRVHEGEIQAADHRSYASTDDHLRYLKKENVDISRSPADVMGTHCVVQKINSSVTN